MADHKFQVTGIFNDKLTNGVKKVKTELIGVEKGVNRLKGAFVGMVAAFTVTKIIDGLKNARQAAKDDKMAQDQLTAALGFTSKALLDQADALEKQFVMENGVVVKTQQIVSQYFKSEEAIKSLTPAIIKMSLATGDSIETIADQLSASIKTGKGIKAYGLTLKGATTEQERLAMMTELVTERFGDSADAAIQNMDGFDKLDVAMKTLSGDIGNELKPLIDQLSDSIINVTNKGSLFTDWLKGNVILIRLLTGTTMQQIKLERELAESWKGTADETDNLTNKYSDLTVQIHKSEDRIKKLKEGLNGLYGQRDTEKEIEKLKSLESQLSLVTAAIRKRAIEDANANAVTEEEIQIYSVTDEELEAKIKSLEEEIKIEEEVSRLIQGIDDDLKNEKLKSIEELRAGRKLMDDEIAARDAAYRENEIKEYEEWKQSTLIIAQRYGAQATANLQDQSDQELQIRLNNLEVMENAIGISFENIIELRRSKAEIEAQIEENAANKNKKRLDDQEKNIRTKINNIDKLSSMGFNIAQNIHEVKMNNIDSEYRRQLESIKSSSNSEEDKASMIESLDKRREASEREALKQKQKWDIGQAIAAGALAVMQTWAGYASMGPVGTGLAVAQTALIAGVTGTQVAAIASQKFEDGGIVEGPSSGDRVNIRANGGEMMINKSQQANLWDIVSGNDKVNNGSNITVEGNTVIIQGTATQETVSQINDVMTRANEDLIYRLVEKGFRTGSIDRNQARL